MKILVVCQHYWPEPYPLTDICEQLVKMGHTVDVITDVPNYPMGYIFPEYKNGKRRMEEHNGVRIIRTFTIGRRNNILFRILNYYSFAVSSTLRAWLLKGEYDVVFANQTSPVMMVNGALSYAKKHSKKCVMYTMDLWPASLAAGGVSESSPLYRFFGWVSKRLYRRADRILITSQMFRGYLQREFGIDEKVIGYLPQYADSTFDAVAPCDKHEGYDFVFAGNIGAAQSLDTVLNAALLLQSEADIRWHIVGDGSELVNLQAKAEQLSLRNVIFHGRKPLTDMPKFYSMADAMVVTLTADPYISLTMPGKVQTYMAAGKPILAASNGEIPGVLDAAQCGFCAPAEDAEGFADCVRRFIACEDKEGLGNRARSYYQTHFTKDMFMKHLVLELEKACQ